MRTLLRSAGMLAVALAILSQPSEAQARKFLSIGAGATLPSGDYGEYAKTGWMGGVGLGTGIGSGNMFIMATGFFGKNSHEAFGGVDGGSTTLMGGGANLGLMSSGESARFYGYVGGGIQNHKFNPPGGGDGGSEAKPYANGMVGVNFGGGSTRFWVQGGMVMGFGDEGEKTSYMPVMAGISIGW